jgi:DNA polymerase III delta subunit
VTAPIDVPAFSNLLSGPLPPAFVVNGEAAGLTEMLALQCLESLKSQRFSAELTLLTPTDMERESPVFSWRTPSFFASHRLFLLPDLADLKKAARDEIGGYLAQPAHQVILFVPASKKDPIASIAGVKAVTLRTDQVESALAGYVASVVKARGASISSSASLFLARWIGADFPRLKAEVEKLAAATEKGKAVGENEIRAVCVAGGYEIDPFKFAEALIGRNREQAITMFRKFAKQAEREEYYKLMGAVAWKVRASAGRLSPEWGAALIDAMASIDRGIKGESELSPEQFVEIRLMKLLG